MKAVYNIETFAIDDSACCTKRLYLVASNPEGYVAVDHEGNGVKFVDRLEFSRANFMVDKGDKFSQNESLTVYWGDQGVSTTHTLLEWRASLPTTTQSNKGLFRMLDSGIPITSLGLNTHTVKESLAAAVNWRINESRRKMKLPTDLLGTIDFPMTEGDGEIVAAVAGGFKPPHRGHLEMIQHYTQLADRVKLFIGQNPRAIRGDQSGRSVTAEQSLAIWQKYLHDAGLADRVEVEIVAGSPMKASYSVLEDASARADNSYGMWGKRHLFLPGGSRQIYS